MMTRFTLLGALTMTASLAAAQTAPTDNHRAADAAKAFSLDLPASTPPADTASPSQAPVPNGAPTMVAFTLDTPIGQLLADPRAKAVVDQNLPGLSDDSNLSKFESMSLRQFQPMTGGQMSNALLAKTGADLAAIGSQVGLVAAVPSPAARHPAVNKKMDSGR